METTARGAKETPSDYRGAHWAVIVVGIYNLGTWIWWRVRQMCSWLAWEMRLGGGAP